ncbi:MAG: hypothetical protein M1444_02055 [Patescibacteria group bacterium]|nr:hypothetical protein [Patescibacteria group bacterium]
MKKKVNIDSTTFWFLYGRYREYLLPIGVIFACILLFFLLIIPQFQNFLDTQEQAKVEANKLLVLRSNLNLLTNMDESQTDSQLQIASTTLPPNKDFSGILDGISAAANKAGVFLGDYEFQVGDISKPSLSIQSFPFLQLTLTINGGVNGVTKFMTELYKTVPLSEVTSVKVTNTNSEITAIFYYRPFPPLGFNNSAPISPVSSQGLSTINTLSLWNNAVKVNQPVLQAPQASSSGRTNPNPF